MTDQEDIQSVSVEALARLAGVNRSTAHRWKTRKTKIPGAVARLLRLALDGDAAALLGPAWRGWRFGRDGLFYCEDWRRGFTSDEIRAMPFLHGECATLKRDLERLTAELHSTTRELEEAQRRARWYRHQLVLESRMGAMLDRISAP